MAKFLRLFTETDDAPDNESTTVFVSSLPSGVSEAWVLARFAPFGKILKIACISQGGMTGRTFAKITFHTADQARAAMKLDQQMIEGARLEIKMKRAG